jgi:beta-phosphoglucomutase-like phosphatase (HAD superfamily)
MDVEEDENSEKDDQNNNISNNEIKDSWMSKRLKDKLLGRIWRRKEEQGLGGASQLDSTEEPTPRGDAAISPIYMQYNGDEKEETGHVEKKELPSWLREKQKEMERLRQMEREGRAKQQQESAPLSSLQDATTSQDDGTSSSSAGSRAAQPSDLDQPRSTKPLSTTAKFNDLMKGMPTLQDMFGDGPGFDNSGSSNSNNDNSPAVSSWQPEPPTQDEVKFDSSDFAHDASEEERFEENAPPPSTLGVEARTKEGLQRRLQALLEQAGSVVPPGQLGKLTSSPSSSSESGESICSGNDDAPEALDGYRNLQKSSITDQRYRSFRRGDNNSSSSQTGGSRNDDETKRQQFESYLKKEQELRGKVGLTGSLEERQEKKYREMQIQNRQQQQQQKAQQQSTEARASVGNNEPTAFEAEKGKRLSNANAADRTAVTLDVYGSDSSLQDWKPKKLSIEEARYRSFAPRNENGNGNGSDGGMSAYESFLKKEKEMREKLGMEQGGKSSVPQVEPKNRGAIPADTASKVDTKTPPKVQPPSDTWIELNEDLENQNANGGGGDDGDSRLYEASFRPTQASVADQKYRALAKKGEYSESKKAAYEAFLKQEREMRQKLGSDVSSSRSFDESNYFVGQANNSGKSEAAKARPDTSFFTDEETLGSFTEDIFDGETSIASGNSPETSKWRAVEEIFEAEHEEKDEYEFEGDIENELKNYEPSGPYDLAAQLFKKDDTQERESFNGGTFSSFEMRRKDLMELTELSVEDINLLFEFESPYLQRLVSKNSPDAVFGAIFRLEGTLVDTAVLQFESWTKTAKKFGFRKPTEGEVKKAVLMRPEEAVRDEFFWTDDVIQSREVAKYHVETLQELFDRTMEDICVSKVMVPVGSLLAEAKYDVRYGSEEANYTAAKEAFPVAEGAVEWLKNLKDVQMPCAVISHLDSAKLETVLNVTGLSDFFPPDARVSADVGYEWERQEYLGACLRLGRRPEKCVVFDSTPSSSRSAHEVDLKAVALMGLYPMYELNTADLAVSSFQELTTLNVRRLFGDKNFDPETQLELEAPQTQVNRKKLRVWSEGDRD